MEKYEAFYIQGYSEHVFRLCSPIISQTDADQSKQAVLGQMLGTTFVRMPS